MTIYFVDFRSSPVLAYTNGDTIDPTLDLSNLKLLNKTTLQPENPPAQLLEFDGDSGVRQDDSNYLLIDETQFDPNTHTSLLLIEPLACGICRPPGIFKCPC